MLRRCTLPAVRSTAEEGRLGTRNLETGHDKDGLLKGPLMLLPRFAVKFEAEMVARGRQMES